MKLEDVDLVREAALLDVVLCAQLADPPVAPVVLRLRTSHEVVRRVPAKVPSRGGVEVCLSAGRPARASDVAEKKSSHP